jgi:hypothetical protein
MKWIYPKGKDYFKRIKNAAQRMQQLIEDLLSLLLHPKNISKNRSEYFIEQVKNELKKKS